MYILLSIISIILSIYGIYLSYEKKNMLIFVWLIVAYYTITSLVSSISNSNISVPIAIKTTYMWSVLLCVLGFLLSDLLFNKKKRTLSQLYILQQDNKIWVLIEIIYWISLVITYLSLRNIDYVEYNTNNKGGGWAQCFFQLSACINFIFISQKKYFKLALSLMLVFYIVEAIHVRSFLFFPLFPIVFYLLYSRMNRYDTFLLFARKSTPMVFVLIGSAIIVGLMRFGEIALPETELTDIAFNSLENWYFGNQYFASTAHYFYRLFGFFINILSHFGVDFVNPLEIYPSVPRLNALLINNITDIDLLQNASHMPATLFFDLYISWGYFCIVYAVIVYYFFIIIFRFFQKDLFTLVLFSSTLGWHMYMLLRGAVDTCSAGINYAFWMSVIMLFIHNKLLKK